MYMRSSCGVTRVRCTGSEELFVASIAGEVSEWRVEEGKRRRMQSGGGRLSRGQTSRGTESSNLLHSFWALSELILTDLLDVWLTMSCRSSPSQPVSHTASSHATGTTAFRNKTSHTSYSHSTASPVAFRHDETCTCDGRKVKRVSLRSSAIGRRYKSSSPVLVMLPILLLMLR